MNNNILHKKLRKSLRTPILGYGLIIACVMMALIDLEGEILGIINGFISGGFTGGKVVQVIAFAFLFIMSIALLVYEVKCIMLFVGLIDHKDIKRIGEGGELQRIENEINEELRTNIIYEDKYMTLIKGWVIGTSSSFFIRRLEDITSVDSSFSANSIYYVRIEYTDETVNTIKLYGRHKAANLERQIRACVNIPDGEV